MDDKKHTYIKSISISQDTFEKLDQSVHLKYSKAKEKNIIPFSKFRRCIFFAYVLGVFSAHQDLESINLFFSCLEKEYIPEIRITKENNNVKIFVCANMKELTDEARKKNSKK